MAKIRGLSFRKQFFFAILLTYITTMAVALLTIFISNNIISGINIFTQDKLSGFLLEEELMKPQLLDFIKNYNEKIFYLDTKPELERILNNKDFKYQVIDLDGKIIYGTLSEKVINNRYDLISRLNTKDKTGFDLKNGIIKSKFFYPVYNNDYNLAGSIIVESYYFLKPEEDSINLINIIESMKQVIPVIYMIIISMFLTFIFSRKLKRPLRELMYATEKIKSKDLDFEIRYDKNDEIGELTGAFNNMKNELQKSLEKQWKLEQDRKDMVKILSHDMKTPLTIIKNHAEYLLDNQNLNNSDRTEFLETIMKNTDRLSKMISEINYTTQLETSGIKLEFRDVNLKNFLIRKKNEYEKLCQPKNIILTTEYQNIKDSTFISIDEEKIEEVLDNIISNSVRFTPETKNIYFRVNNENEKVSFEIIDEGEGFSDKDLQYLFEKFYKGKNNLEKGHCGLGMYITKLIIEKHGGEIKAENEKEQGAKISFYILKGRELR